MKKKNGKNRWPKHIIVGIFTNGNGTIHIHRKREYFYIFWLTWSICYKDQLLFLVVFNFFLFLFLFVFSFLVLFKCQVIGSFFLDLQYINAVRRRAFTTTTTTKFDCFTTVRYGLQMYSWIVSFRSVACTKTSEMFFSFWIRKSRLTLICMLFKQLNIKTSCEKTDMYTHEKQQVRSCEGFELFAHLSHYTRWAHYKRLLYIDIPFLFHPKKTIIMPNPPLFRSSLSPKPNNDDFQFNRCELNQTVSFFHRLYKPSVMLLILKDSCFSYVHTCHNWNCTSRHKVFGKLQAISIFFSNCCFLNMLYGLNSLANKQMKQCETCGLK